MRQLRRTVLLQPPVALLLILSNAPAGAAFLRALVAEVPDGATLVVVNSNRRLTVVLKGVEAPRDAREAEQARRHLAALALGREVVVEYTGLRGQNIHGRAVCGGMDLGLQLVRDGAARYDGAADNALSEAERQVYAESERAARAERRGVWRAAEASAEVAAVASVQLALTTNVSVAPPSERTARRSLSTEDLIVRRMAASAGAGKGAKSGGGGAATPKQSRWPLNRPGEEFDFSRHLGQGRTTVVYFYADWCPACREVSPMMRAINSNAPDVEVLALDIDRWGSPVAAAHGVSFVPYFQIYDESGYLIAEGKQAARWLAEEAAKRARTGG